MLPIAGGGVSTQAFQFYTMLGKGNGWKLALYQNKRLAVHILSTFNAYEERSLYEFQAKDIPIFITDLRYIAIAMIDMSMQADLL
ncbi:hypothetical protein [Pseudoalteromonas luteoviolacea]|uniref:Uncharacterized protein n=1 Tax=Pseudoalteromonas luteoviolacea NCIMB 1942 TaxID=1365253 RepID=A0A167C9B5_9GAMM|nr:hypothetical protein [Pseudoalteromonas luteoviolacea]KZN47395.1 hypothetical protein N482_09555 [Pseudoalteromonas luteoviolacea NCIMB 1942]